MSQKGNIRKDNSLLIELKNITRSFGYGEAESFALNDFNLEVKPGEFIMIMGPSGCGKTTLLNIIGLLDFPTSGSYYLDSERTTVFSKSHQAHIRAQKIGFIFQDFNLIPKMTILENVSLPLLYAGVSKTKRLIKSSEMLAYLNMQQREYYNPYQLSGGQKQRVAIARALVSSPEIILADEPTGNLDSHNAHLVMEELRRIHSKGNTIIMVTHNPNLTSYATRVIHMLDGRIATDIKTVADEDLPERIKVNFQSKKLSESIQDIINTQESEKIEQPEIHTIHVRPIQKVGFKNPDSYRNFNLTPQETLDSSSKNNFLSTDQASESIESSHPPIVPPDPTFQNIEKNEKPESKIPNLSYKYPTSTEISVDESASPIQPKSFSKSETNTAKSTFPVVSSSSNDSSIRIVKKTTILEELERSTTKQKTKTKVAKTNKKQAKGRRK